MWNTMGVSPPEDEWLMVRLATNSRTTPARRGHGLVHAGILRSVVHPSGLSIVFWQVALLDDKPLERVEYRDVVRWRRLPGIMRMCADIPVTSEFLYYA